MKSAGEIAESRFLLRALENGYSVSIPFGDNQKYDFILDNGKTLLRIQIKSSGRELSETGALKGTVSHGRTKKSYYTRDDIDLLCYYVACVDSFYILPVAKISSRKTIYLYPKKEDCSWRDFQENWEIIKKLG